jgi:hypothetical protein
MSGVRLLPRRNLFRRLTKGTFGEGVTLSSDKIFFQLGQHDIIRGQQPVAFAKSGRTAISCGKVAASCAVTQQSRSCQMLLRSKPSHGTHWTRTLRSLGLDRELVRAADKQSMRGLWISRVVPRHARGKTGWN